MNKNLKILIFLLLTSYSLSAQDKTWTLEECVAYALDHNLQLNSFRYAEKSGREEYRQSIRNLLPSLDASTSYIINLGRSTDPFTNDIVTTEFFSNFYNINVSIDLFQGFQKVNAIKATKFLYEAVKEDKLQQKYLLGFRVMQAFYDIWFFEGLVRISKEQLEVSKENFALVEKRLELGLIAGADIHQAKSLLLTDELNLTQSENRLREAKQRLIQEMNLESAKDITVKTNAIGTEKLQENTAVSTDSIYEKAIGFLPLIKAQELREKAAKKQLAAARGGLFPSLSLFGGIGTGYFETTTDANGVTIPFRDQFRDNTFQFVGATLTIPISRIWANRSQVNQRKIEYKQSQNDLDILQQELYQTIQNLVQDYRSLLIEIEQSNERVKALEFAFSIAQKRYEKGLINAIELTTAKNLLASAQNENLQVNLRYQINKSTLNFYRGIQILNINE